MTTLLSTISRKVSRYFEPHRLRDKFFHVGCLDKDILDKDILNDYCRDESTAIQRLKELSEWSLCPAYIAAFCSEIISVATGYLNKSDNESVMQARNIFENRIADLQVEQQHPLLKHTIVNKLIDIVKDKSQYKPQYNGEDIERAIAWAEDYVKAKGNILSQSSNNLRANLGFEREQILKKVVGAETPTLWDLGDPTPTHAILALAAYSWDANELETWIREHSLNANMRLITGED